MKNMNVSGLDRHVFLLNLLWFNALVGSTGLIALAMWVAFGSGVEIGPGPSEAFSAPLRYLAGSAAILVVVGLGVFRARLFSVHTMKEIEPGSGLSLGAGDPAVKRSAAQLGNRMFIALGIADIPAIVLIGIGLMENAMEPLLLAAVYSAVVSLAFRPPIRALMEELVDYQLNTK